MAEELTQKELKLLYYLYIRRGRIGSTSKLGKDTGSGKRIYERKRKQEQMGYIKEEGNRIKVTELGKQQLQPFIYTHMIITLFIPVVGIAQIFLWLLGLLFPTFFTLYSL